MSTGTQAIEALCRIVTESFQEATESKTVSGEVVAALAELEAIRTAARVVVDASSDLLSSDRHEEYRRSMETLQAIAKEEP